MAAVLRASSPQLSLRQRVGVDGDARQLDVHQRHVARICRRLRRRVLRQDTQQTSIDMRTFSIASSTSRPWMTLPKTVYLPARASG